MSSLDSKYPRCSTYFEDLIQDSKLVVYMLKVSKRRRVEVNIYLVSMGLVELVSHGVMLDFVDDSQMTDSLRSVSVTECETFSLEVLGCRLMDPDKILRMSVAQNQMLT